MHNIELKFSSSLFFWTWDIQCCRFVDFTSCSVDFLMSLVIEHGFQCSVDLVDFSIDSPSHLWIHNIYELFTVKLTYLTRFYSYV